jgi:polysaccharide biosynthesis transport protein
MPNDIQIYPGESAGGPLAPGEYSAPSTEGVAPVSLVGALRRQWRLILVVWLLPTMVAAPVLYLTVKRSYTATAQVQVSPVLQPILYADASTQAMPFFDAYLSTQMELITSQPVLTAALSDPAVSDLPLVKTANPLLGIRLATAVKRVGPSHLLEIAVTQGSPDEAVRLNKAVVDAYMARVVGAEESEQLKKLKVLEPKRDELEARLNSKEKELADLANEYGTTTETMAELLRQGILQSITQTRGERERTQLEILQAEEQIKQLDSSAADAPLTETEVAERERSIENDPMVRALRDQIVESSRQLLQLKSEGLTDLNNRVIYAKGRKDQLEKQLERELSRAGTDAENKIKGSRQGRAEVIRAATEQRLTLARQRLKVLDDFINAEEKRGLDISKRGIEIGLLQEEIKRLKDEKSQVDAEIRKLDFERFRPARVSVASAAELRPEGVKDSRKKLGVMVLFGSLVLGLAAALVRDRFDPHLRDPDEVAAGMGLRLLGAVPCLSELKAGKVAREDFIESYRLVRATLSAVGGDDVPPKSMLVTSAQAAEGKTSLAVSLAASLAEPGCRVLLIDGDLQAPQIRRLLKLTPVGSLEGVLLGERSLAESVTRSSLAGVDVLVSGLNGVSGQSLLNHRSAAGLLHEAGCVYDHIVIDSSPCLSSAGTLVWAHLVDGVIISSLAGQSNMTAMRLGCDRLRAVGARLLGSVIGNVSRRESYYSYSSASIDHEDAGSLAIKVAGRRRERRGPPVVQLPDEQAPAGPDGA